MGNVKKSKRWGGEWTRVGKRGKWCPGPTRSDFQNSFTDRFTS